MDLSIISFPLIIRALHPTTHTRARKKKKSALTFNLPSHLPRPAPPVPLPARDLHDRPSNPKFDAEDSGTKSRWLDALRGCLANAKYHNIILRSHIAPVTAPCASSKALPVNAPTDKIARALRKQRSPSSDGDNGSASSSTSFDDISKKYELQRKARVQTRTTVSTTA